ncbi:flocculation protein FLO11 isoform X2 [Hippocampus comes]|uniref:flocculation protein FLO11 isoform X2 n=1 Tax=Hippocampus comes TaxID=109280 RepID=UPI00094EBFDC|nr:PREDICTED: flocculation protein FLO11-like isoform X2 [Hippocampus comes]
MQSCRLYLGTIVILSSVVPPVTAFSRGAGPASCQTMSPGHIRAQPQDLQQNHITIRTSVNSYLPGQLVTVTVRSSRDFMGFLLQARSGDDSQVMAAIAGGAGSPAEGPVLVRGSWTLAPPGTHTLRCLSEGDTLTHSDKQLKRNLSFVWRAPDAPVGDIRFYVTVVQSYFVYWAGIKSAVVRDGSQSLWTGRNTTGAETEGSVFGPRDRNFTPVPAPLNKPSQPTGPTPFGKPNFTPKTVWSRTASPVALAGNQQGQGLGKNNYSILQHSRGLPSDSYPDIGSLAEESSSDPSSSHLPFITPLPPDEGIETLSTFAPNVLLHSLASLRNWKDTESRMSTPNPRQPPENHRVFYTRSSVPTFYKPTGPRNVTASLFAYVIQTRLSTSQRSDATHEGRGSSLSPLHSRSNADIDGSSTQTISHSRPFLPTSLKPAVQKLLLQPHTKSEDNPSDSRDGPSRPPANSHQTLLHTFVSQSQTTVSYTSKNLLPSDRAIEAPRTRPQPRSKANLQTVSPYTSTMLKSVSIFDSFGSSSRDGITQASPSRNTLDVSKRTTKNLSFTHSSSQDKSSPVFSALPKPSPVSMPPKSISIILSSTLQTGSSSTSSKFLSSNSINSPSSSRATFSPRGPFSSSSIPGTTRSSSSSPTTGTPAISSSSFSTKLSIPSSSSLPSPISTSMGSLSLNWSAFPSSQATSLHPGPSPAPRRSLNSRPSIPPLPLPSQKQTRIASSNPRQEFNPSTSNRKIESNIGKELKPNPPKLDTKLLFNPSKMPGVEGKYPEIVPRHSSWELGMLLGCSAGLGMALVVGVRYVYRQACGKRTEITLHDRERDYGRGERGMIHVQECGDLVRVRRIRENSLVLLAEYDILASPGD